MSGSGARIGMGIIHRAVSRTRLAPARARTACTAAAVGTTAPGTAVQRIATGSRPTTAATTWGCASRGQRRPYLKGEKACGGPRSEASRSLKGSRGIAPGRIEKMRLKIVTLTFDERLHGFPEEPLKRAISGGQVLQANEYFYEYGGLPRLTLVLRLADEGVKSIGSKRQGPDPYDGLPKDRKGLYVELRRWRNERAEADGVPPFVILRNDLIAEVCRRVPRTLAALKEIPGIGEKTCSKYGNGIIQLIPEDMQPVTSEPVENPQP